MANLSLRQMEEQSLPVKNRPGMIGTLILAIELDHSLHKYGIRWVILEIGRKRIGPKIWA